ncbi:MAG: ribonuclease H [bacterium]
MEDPNALNIYTDGSSFPHPRKGGVGILFKFPDIGDKEGFIKELNCESYKKGTSQQMEIMACIKALEECFKIFFELKNISRIIIHTDSMYVVNGYTLALNVWSKNGWTLRDGGPVLNVDLWKKLLVLVKKVSKRVDFQHVEGHSVNIYNKKVDKLARKSAQNLICDSSGSTKIIRRKTVSKETEKGSVKIIGQKISIRIVDSEYLKEHDVYRYRYEVISRSSDFYKKMDFITSHIPLKAGHSFVVRFNKEQNNPVIKKLFKEI